jgi:hypothetical protein
MYIREIHVLYMERIAICTKHRRKKNPEKRARYTIQRAIPFHSTAAGHQLLSSLPEFSIPTSIPRFPRLSGLHAIPAPGITSRVLQHNAGIALITE